MKICHVLPLLSADSTFDGPARVALSQASGLSKRGHSVIVVATSDGHWENSDPDLDVRTFTIVRWSRRVGLGGPAYPSVWREIRRLARQVDVFHFHLGRDGVTLPACLVAKSSRTPYVVQCHGMVMPDGREMVGVADGLATRRALHDAARVLYLTDQERAGLVQVGGVENNLRLERLVNGIDVRPPAEQDGASQARRSGILFCSRLHPGKRVIAFAEMFSILRARGTQEEAFVVGPDDGELPALFQAIDRLGLNGTLHYEGNLAHEDVLERVRQARVLVIPSEDEPLPMISLEAMAVGTPVVVTNSCHIAEELAEADAAVVSDPSPESLADSVQTLLGNRFRAQATADHASDLIGRRYAIARVLDSLEAVYREAVLPRLSGTS